MHVIKIWYHAHNMPYHVPTIINAYQQLIVKCL
jgi:hypothetical protein